MKFKKQSNTYKNIITKQD